MRAAWVVLCLSFMTACSPVSPNETGTGGGSGTGGGAATGGGGGAPTGGGGGAATGGGGGASDAGETGDAGAVDAGEVVDAGDPDAGDLVDAGEFVDAGEPEAGEFVDAGEPDAGELVDGGIPLDAGVPPTCGNAMIEGSETCDDGDTDSLDGCSATCGIESGWTCAGSPSLCASTCGDGVVVGLEACDDGNLQSADGCSSSCVVESSFECNGAPSVCLAVNQETEVNDSCVLATGPFVLAMGSPTLIRAAISPTGDVDSHAFTLTTRADVRFETFDASGRLSCTGTLDTEIQIFGSSTCSVTGPFDDDDGQNFCSRLSPMTDPFVRQMAPGTYVVRVVGRSVTSGGYSLLATMLSSCGNGVLEGFEQCDGSTGCGADCRLP